MKVLQVLSSCAVTWLATAALVSANAADPGVSQSAQRSLMQEQQLALPLSSIPSHSPIIRTLDVTPLSPSPTPAMIRVLADTTTATPKPAATKQRVCRQYLPTQCSDSRPVCIKDCRDRLVQALALQEAQDAYIAIRGLEKDALGVYVDYREQQDKLTLDSFPQATEWLFLSGIQLNGKLDYDFPEDEAAENESSSLLKSVIFAGENAESIEKVNFPDQVTTMYLSYNALDRLEHTELPPTLETLSLNWNSIAIIRNVTFPKTLSKFYFVENPISLISLSEPQWETFLAITNDFVSLDGEPSVETSCVTGYFGPTKKHPFLACLLGEEPAYI